MYKGIGISKGYFMWCVFSFYITVENAYHKNVLVKFILLTITLARKKSAEKIVDSSRTRRLVYSLYFIKL